MTQPVSAVLKELRQSHRLTQRDLARAVGASHSLVAQWETAALMVGRRYLDRLAQRFPEYRAELYVAARRLPEHLPSETEYRLRAALE